tara:strand:- start:1176 stop:1457 length:282 start_codon:yes stop_codon:yes gene_type:complete
MSNENEDDDILSDAEKILYFRAVDDNGSDFFESRLTEENLDEELQKIRDYYFEWLESEEEWKEMRLERDRTNALLAAEEAAKRPKKKKRFGLF